MVRNSTKFASYKDLKKVCTDLRAISSAVTEEASLDALAGSGEKCGEKNPMISWSWENHWDDLCEFSGTRLRFAVRSLYYQLRKVTKTVRHSAPTTLHSRYCTWRFATRRKNGRCRLGIAGNQFTVEFGKERVPF